MKKIFLLLAIPLLLACKKEENTQIQVRLTDAPGDFKEVNIDLEEVNVKLDKGSWQTLTTNKGIYNLLELRNGIDTLIATGSLANDGVKEIRLVLGANNSVTLESGEVFDLKVPSGSESGLKIKLGNAAYGELDVLLDFDAEKSVVRTDTGFLLKPVIKIK